MSHHDQARPAAGERLTPAPATTDPAAPPANPVLELSHAAMNLAYRDGLSTLFGLTVPWIMRYQDSWWVLYEGGWLRITDQPTAADLDRLAVQMSQADVTAARDNAIRQAVDPDGAPGHERPPLARPSS
jgi:hypothetical protein